MTRAVAAPLPFDWDALRTVEWHEARARRRAVRAEFQRVRDAGLARRHAVRLAWVHGACTAEGCVVSPVLRGRCPARVDAPGFYDPRSGRVVDESELEVLTREEMGERLASRDRPTAARSAPAPEWPAETVAGARAEPAAETQAPAAIAVGAGIGRSAESMVPAGVEQAAEGCRDSVVDEHRDRGAGLAGEAESGVRLVDQAEPGTRFAGEAVSGARLAGDAERAVRLADEPESGVRFADLTEPGELQPAGTRAADAGEAGRASRASGLRPRLAGQLWAASGGRGHSRWLAVRRWVGGRVGLRLRFGPGPPALGLSVR
jgi:hypothetical protein